MIKGLVFEKGFLKEIKTPGFVKNDLVPDQPFNHLVGRIVIEPAHGTMKAPFYRTESRNDSVFEILDMREHFVFFHGQSKHYARKATTGVL